MAAAAAFKRTASSAVQFIRHRHFSSTSAANHRTWGVYCDDDSEGEESAVYQHTLKFQRPSIIKQYQVAHNSVSLVGTIELPLKRINTTNGSFGLQTLLRVSAPSLSHPSFRMLLKMWDNIAKMSMEHLKPRDLVYISGNLRSYMKADKNGTPPRLRHEVAVNEINFVTPDVQASPCAEFEKKESGCTGENEQEKYRNQLHLWQVLFANPSEWIDFRKSKVNPRHPDFKHRDTGEALWLSTGDPPWIKRQLEILDL